VIGYAYTRHQPASGARPDAMKQIDDAATIAAAEADALKSIVRRGENDSGIGRPRAAVGAGRHRPRRSSRIAMTLSQLGVESIVIGSAAFGLYELLTSVGR